MIHPGKNNKNNTFCALLTCQLRSEQRKPEWKCGTGRKQLARDFFSTAAAARSFPRSRRLFTFSPMGVVENDRQTRACLDSSPIPIGLYPFHNSTKEGFQFAHESRCPLRLHIPAGGWPYMSHRAKFFYHFSETRWRFKSRKEHLTTPILLLWMASTWYVL